MNSKIPFVLDFDLVEGYCKSGAVKPIARYVSNMVSQFADSAAAEEMVANGNFATANEKNVLQRNEDFLKNNKALRFIAQTSKKEFIRLFLLSVFHTVNSFLAVYFALVMRNIINFAVSGEREAAYRSAAVLVAVVIIQIILFILS